MPVQPRSLEPCARDADPALVPPPVNTAPGPEYGDDTRIFQGIPGLERAPNGRLWALWYAGGPEEPGEGAGNYVLLVTSADDGQIWSGPRLVIDPPGLVRAYDPCLWHDPLGRLWLFWAQSCHHWDGRAGVWAIVARPSRDAGSSNDECPTWSAPRRLCDGIMMNKPTVLSTGEWLLPAAVWERPAGESTPPRYRHNLGARRGANVICSTDEGRTWTFRGQALVPERVFDEHAIVERRDGGLRMWVRTAYGIGESRSTDGGRTWTPGQPAQIPHVNSRFHLRRLHSGRLLAVTHNPPDSKTRSHLVARLSDDDGQSWQGGLTIDERPGVSYPDGVQSPDGTIYLIYDYRRQADKRILMAVFTEQDVLRGAWQSSRARQRVLVNQATGTAHTEEDR
jgi:predicted neuraminidase